MPGCEGGKYTGVASPRRDEPYKYYPNFRLNKMDGPEDHGTMNTRCLGGNVPVFNGYRQIVQSPGAVSIFYDVGQGKDSTAPSPSQRGRIFPHTSARGGATR